MKARCWEGVNCSNTSKNMANKGSVLDTLQQGGKEGRQGEAGGDERANLTGASRYMARDHFWTAPLPPRHIGKVV
jgi:hypothetical protein